MRSVESAEQQALQIKPLWFLLSVNDALGETLTFLDIRTLIALRLAFQLPESFLQIQIPLLQEEIIHFVNKGIEILWTDESSVDALLSILINCTQNTDAINKHWDQFKWNISTGDGGQEREAKFLGVLARFPFFLKDNTKINECIKLTFHFLEYTAQSRWEPRGTLLTWEPEKALLSCFIKLLIAVQN